MSVLVLLSVRGSCSWGLEGRCGQPDGGRQRWPRHGGMESYVLHHQRRSETEFWDPNKSRQQRRNAVCGQSKTMYIRLPRFLKSYQLNLVVLHPFYCSASRLWDHCVPQTPHQSAERGSFGSWCWLRSQLHSNRPRHSWGHQWGTGLLPRPLDRHQDGKHPRGQLCGFTQRFRPRHTGDAEY